jgi:hypothetical protein
MARKTPEQRLAEATQARLRAEFDILAERGAAAAIPGKHVAAVRRAMDLFELLGWSPGEVQDARDHIDDCITEVENGRAADAEARAATKAVGK